MNAVMSYACLSAADPAFHICQETFADHDEREALLDRVMGHERFAKGSETLRRGRDPAYGLAFLARAENGIIGTVRLWDVEVGGDRSLPIAALMLGPLAVDDRHGGRGAGSALMRHAISAARAHGHGAIVLVGDPGYYRRFGFDAVTAGAITMPGRYERRRLLALELSPGWLGRARGMVRAPQEPMRLAA